jgi:integrase
MPENSFSDGAMPRPSPPHLQRHVTRHGRVVWYVRIGRGPRTRIKAEYGTDDFWQEYRDALSGKPPRHGKRAAAGTVQWLYDRYRETGAWSELSSATRRQRENIFKHVMAAIGHERADRVTRTSVQAAVDRRSKATPAQARNFLDAMKGLYRWGHKAGHVAIDPTVGVETVAKAAGDGFAPWTEADVEAYERRWPHGTRERVWLHVLLYTGLRRGDAVRIGRQHVRDGVATIRTEKSGETITVTLPILKALQRTLDKGPIGDLAWICGSKGRPFTKESFGNAFADAARAAGVRKSAHGVRKIAATRAAQNGATEAELEALFGWTTGSRQSAVYTRTADRARLARQAIEKLNEARTETPTPKRKVWARTKKTK